jgi:hypothetical protein
MKKTVTSLLTILLTLGLGVGLFTFFEEDAEAQWGYVARAMPPLSTDGTNITLASGQLLLPNGAVGTPSLSFTNGTTDGIYHSGTDMFFAMNGAAVFRQTDTYMYVGTGIGWTGDTDSVLYRIGADNIGLNVGGALVMDWENTNAAGAGADLVTISSTLGAMDSADDVVRGLWVDLVNANHTNGSFYGIAIDDMTPDANANEYAIYIETTWDIDLVGQTELNLAATAGGGTVNLDLENSNAAGAGADLLTLSTTLNIMDDDADTVRGIFVDLTNANHTSAVSYPSVYGIDVDTITGDANANEVAYVSRAGWDVHYAAIGDSTRIGFPSNNSLIIGPASTVVGYQTLFFINHETGGTGVEYGSTAGNDRAVVGNGQTVNPLGDVFEISAAAAADVTVITAPGSSIAERLTIICKDANVTLNDSDLAGAAATMNLQGAATNFTCSEGDTITLVYNASPGSGNARWEEIARSVN